MSIRKIILVPIYFNLVVFIAMLSFMGHNVPNEPTTPNTPASNTQVEALTKGHDCWTTGRNSLPNAAVVTLTDSSKPIFTTNRKLVDAAFNKALGGNEPSITTLHFLCIK